MIRYTRLFLIHLLGAYASLCSAQLAFTYENHLLGDSTIHSSWFAVGVSDLNADSLDDIIRIDKDFNITVEYQKESGGFTISKYGSISSLTIWGVTVADLDENGVNDIYLGADDSIYVYLMNSGGLVKERYTIYRYTYPQAPSMVDVNDDGWIDVFECSDTSANLVFVNDTKGNLIQIPGFELGKEKGNYSAIWTDYDLDDDLDLYLSKCWQFALDSADTKRINQLFRNDGNAKFTDVADIAGVDDGSQSWSSTAGDIDNDGDLDLYVANHGKCKLFLNNGDGTFNDISNTAGIDSGSVDICKFVDLDNDTYLDLVLGQRGLTLGGNGMIMRNLGNNTFTRVVNAMPDTTGSLRSSAIGDLNNDGYQDLIVTGGLRDRLMINKGNSNNYLDVLLFGQNGNRNAIGAKILIYGGWGVQIREVRSGESYGIMNSLTQHFGLGSNQTIDSLIVKWPLGKVTKLYDVDINQKLVLKEEPWVGISEERNDHQINLYPNPTSGLITFELIRDIQNKFITLQLFNLNGRKVSEYQLTSGQSHNIDVSHLGSGVYHYQVISEKQPVRTGKLVIK